VPPREPQPSGAVGGRRHTALRPGPLSRWPRMSTAARWRETRRAAGKPPTKDHCGQRQHGEALAQPDLRDTWTHGGRREQQEVGPHDGDAFSAAAATTPRPTQGLASSTPSTTRSVARKPRVPGKPTSPARQHEAHASIASCRTGRGSSPATAADAASRAGGSARARQRQGERKPQHSAHRRLMAVCSSSPTRTNDAWLRRGRRRSGASPAGPAPSPRRTRPSPARTADPLSTQSGATAGPGGWPRRRRSAGSRTAGRCRTRRARTVGHQQCRHGAAADEDGRQQRTVAQPSAPRRPRPDGKRPAEHQQATHTVMCRTYTRVGCGGSAAPGSPARFGGQQADEHPRFLAAEDGQANRPGRPATRRARNAASSSARWPGR